MTNDEQLKADMTSLRVLPTQQQSLDVIAAQPNIHAKDLDRMVTLGDPVACAAVCHTLARNAGWWTDLQTGEPLRKNAADLFNLISSEINEAFEGYRRGMQDDHLPHRPMLEVELADAKIRIYDTVGGMGWPVKWLDIPPRPDDRSPSRWLASANRYVFRAWEVASDVGAPGTKVETTMVAHYLGMALRDIDALAIAADLDVQGAMFEKLAYNINRADHKREARLADGGKKL